MTRPLVAVFAANHGIAERGVSAFPQSVTKAMVANFAAGGAAINQLCTANGLGLKVFELALDHPTPDIVEADAFDEKGCAATIAYGMEAVAGGVDLLCLGEMGIANTTVAAAIYHALYGGAAEYWVGRGTGVDDAGLKRKADAVGRGGQAHRGGTRPARSAAQTRRARDRRDGRRDHRRAHDSACRSSSTASSRPPPRSILHALDPKAIDHCLFAHCSAEAAHRAVLHKLGKPPLLDLGLRLGEGTGAALAAGIVKAALAAHNGMATFEEAGVAGKE